MRIALKEARLRKNLTQAELARRLHITQQSYQAIESGKTYPRRQTAQMLKKELDITLDLIYEEDDDDE